MAVDLSNKQVNLASRIVSSTDKLIQAMKELVELEDEKTSSGINFDDTFLLANNATKHVSGQMLNDALTSALAINSFAVTNFHDDNLQKIRP